jgi:diaphanous 1
VDVIDVTASVNSLALAQKQASAELPHLSPDDPLVSHLQSFVDKTTPRIQHLRTLHQDMLSELASLQVFFAEKPDSVEETFTTILSFALTLQKAAVEMSKFPDPIKPKPIISKVPALHTTAPSTGSDTTPTGTLARGPTMTMKRGELDEAIRSIHGGVRRRERREASMASVAGSVKLSRMFLDGAGSSRGTMGRGTQSRHTKLGSVFR